MDYTAKLLRKYEDEIGRVTVDVEYTNGIKTFVESFKPATKADYNFIVESKLKGLNSLETFKQEDNIGQEIVVTPEATPPTAAELEFATWRDNYYELESLLRYKKAIEDAGLTLEQTQIGGIATLANTVRTGFKPAYRGKF